MANRIGPQMLAAVSYVARNPGCAILPAASSLSIGTRTGKNNAHGYNVVHRAIDAGLIDATVCKGRYSLYVSARGFKVLA